MADSKITALASIGTGTDPANDPLVIVDVSDVSPGGMSATGTTKKVTLNNLLACSPTATLASATITGDLTVDTSTLKVDSANNRVGIGTASPAAALVVNLPEVSSAAGTSAIISNTTGGGNRIAALRLANLSNQWNIRAYGAVTDDLRFGSGATGSEVDYLSIGNTGIFTWSNVGGVAGTAMTLNSTGLGVGTATHSTRLGVVDAGNTFAATFRGNGGTNFVAIGTTGFGASINGYTAGFASAADLVLQPNGGNVGIGVTPSAWSSYKALQVGSIGSLSSVTGATIVGNNWFYDGASKYITTAASTIYEQGAGTHAWYSAASGTAGTAVSFGSAKMTLDASGRLGVGVVPASNTRTHFKGSSTSTDYINYCVNSSDKLAFGIRNDGLLITGSSADSATLPSSPYNLTSGSAANVFVDSQGIFYRSTSSLKYKTDIADSTRGLADVLKLRPVTYKAKNSGDTVFGGLIAEEVDAAGLTEFVQYAPDNTPDAIHYGNMVSLLVAAIKELTARVQTLETR